MTAAIAHASPRGSPPPSSERGFTLVELLVALSLFSLLTLAIMVLTGNATRVFAFTQGQMAAVESLERMRTLMSSDLGQAARRPSIAADGGLLPAFTLMPQGFVLVRRGVGGRVPPIQKIAWGFDGQSLLRQSFQAIDGAPPGPATVLVANVRAVQLRVADASGWQSEWKPEKPEDLPRALELTIVRHDGIPVTIKFLVGI